jgi:hypothetical protein
MHGVLHHVHHIAVTRLNRPKMTWTRLYDPSRTPSHWTEFVRKEQFVVFIFEARTQAPRDADGLPFCAADGSETGQYAALCEDLAEARNFAREVVARHPELCCRIYDSQGKSGPPLEVIYDPSVRHRYTGFAHARRLALGHGTGMRWDHTCGDRRQPRFRLDLGLCFRTEVFDRSGYFPESRLHRMARCEERTEY